MRRADMRNKHVDQLCSTYESDEWFRYRMQTDLPFHRLNYVVGLNPTKASNENKLIVKTEKSTRCRQSSSWLGWWQARFDCGAWNGNNSCASIFNIVACSKRRTSRERNTVNEWEDIRVYLYKLERFETERVIICWLAPKSNRTLTDRNSKNCDNVTSFKRVQRSMILENILPTSPLLVNDNSERWVP